MNITVRRLFTFSLIPFLLCGCQKKPAQETEETAPPVEEPTSEPAETETPSPEPEPAPFDISGVKWILIGDSLTDKTMAAQISYYDFVQKDFQCEVVNCGRSSTGYVIAPDYETFYQRIDLIERILIKCEIAAPVQIIQHICHDSTSSFSGTLLLLPFILAH